MKNLLLSSILSLASVALWAAASQAGAFGLIPSYCCPFHKTCGGCCSKYCSTICITPYNAFTPICCGNMCYQGCCPGMCGMPCCGFPCCAPQQMCCQPQCGYPACCPSMACAPSCTSLPAPCGVPSDACATPCAPPAVSPCAPPLAPSVLPVPAGTPGVGMRTAPQAAPVQTAAYQQANPYNYAPMVPPTVAPMGYQPWYWAPGGSGR